MPDKSWKGTQHTTGSVAQYVKRGCRCDNCRKVTTEYYRKRKAIRLALISENEPSIIRDNDATYIKGDDK